MRFCDEQDFGFGWLDDEDPLRRASHALVVDGGVWLIDPFAWQEAEARARTLGEPRGVVQLLDRHERDCAATAERLGVPLHRVPTGKLDGAPFELLAVASNRFWRESAFWWPERRVLVVADALGISCALFFVTDFLFRSPVPALVTALVAGTIALSWYGLPLFRKATD